MKFVLTKTSTGWREREYIEIIDLEALCKFIVECGHEIAISEPFMKGEYYQIDIIDDFRE